MTNKEEKSEEPDKFSEEDALGDDWDDDDGDEDEDDEGDSD